MTIALRSPAWLPWLLDCRAHLLAPGTTWAAQKPRKAPPPPPMHTLKMSSLHFTTHRHGLLFVGTCGRLLHAEAGSAEEQARWLALLPDEATPSCDETVMLDETLVLLVP